MAKKHKKKVYNTPKKIKHSNRKISLTNFIDSLNNPKCDKCSSSMAIHQNRYYCGKCCYSINHNSYIEPEKV